MWDIPDIYNQWAVALRAPSSGPWREVVGYYHTIIFKKKIFINLDACYFCIKWPLSITAHLSLPGDILPSVSMSFSLCSLTVLTIACIWRDGPQNDFVNGHWWALSFIKLRTPEIDHSAEVMCELVSMQCKHVTCSCGVCVFVFRRVVSAALSPLSAAGLCWCVFFGCWRMLMQLCWSAGSQSCLCCTSTDYSSFSTSPSPALSTRYYTTVPFCQKWERL